MRKKEDYSLEEDPPPREEIIYPLLEENEENFYKSIEYKFEPNIIED